jgi:hypothetical protein
VTHFGTGGPGEAGGPRDPAGAGGTSRDDRSGRPARAGGGAGADESAGVPALTRAEGEFVDRYLAVVDLMGRMNPGRGGETSTYGHLRSAQALVAEATALRDALTAMLTRGERELFPSTLARAMRALDGERRAARVTLA